MKQVICCVFVLLVGCDNSITCESLGLIRVGETCVSLDAGTDALTADASPSDAMPLWDASIDAPTDGSNDGSIDPSIDGGADTRDANVDACAPVEEQCNGVDDDCDGLLDEDVQRTFYEDFDADGFGNPDETCVACDVAECPGERRWVAEADDCDDGSDAVAPGAPELCDMVDNDCDGVIDEFVTTTFYRDVDGDGFGEGEDTVEACELPDGYTNLPGDCAPGDPDAFPGQTEYFDRPRNGVGGYDYDCDGEQRHEFARAGTLNCTGFPCPTQRRWERMVPPCGNRGTIQYCTRGAGVLTCAGE